MTCINLAPEEDKCYKICKKIFSQYVQSVFLEIELKKMLINDEFLKAKIWIKQCAAFIVNCKAEE